MGKFSKGRKISQNVVIIRFHTLNTVNCCLAFYLPYLLLTQAKAFCLFICKTPSAPKYWRTLLCQSLASRFELFNKACFLKGKETYFQGIDRLFLLGYELQYNFPDNCLMRWITASQHWHYCSLNAIIYIMI